MNDFKPKKILVTGSAGFIGCNFVRYMLAKYSDINIISLDKLTYAGNKKNLANLSDAARHIFIQGDICDRNLVDKILREHEIDTIVHFAAESHVDRSIEGPSAFIETNIVGTFTLLDAARCYWLEEKGWGALSDCRTSSACKASSDCCGAAQDYCGAAQHCRFHHISTDEVYGELEHNDPPFSETTPYAPSSPYSASKASSDHLARAYSRTYKMPITVSNCSNNYGPYQHAEKLIPTVIRSCVERKAIPVYGNGSNIRDWLYVEDHCAAIDAILHKGKVGETYNIGGNCEKDNLSLVKNICEIMDGKNLSQGFHEKLITFVEDRKGHDWRYAIDNTKIANTLNWRPKYSFEQGLLATVEYYLGAFK